mmetsp:Transcript_72126/g.154432  ORF Transcript_72126/g.154432 Transcript_72126/m.154432 type:complete len:343 (+) Transcript_72126:113-1141(+)
MLCQGPSCWAQRLGLLISAVAPELAARAVDRALRQHAPLHLAEHNRRHHPVLQRVIDLRQLREQPADLRTELVGLAGQGAIVFSLAQQQLAEDTDLHSIKAALIKEIHHFEEGAALTESMDQWAVGQPTVSCTPCLQSLTTDVVDDLELKLHLLVDTVVKVNDLILIGAEPHNKMDRQVVAHAPQLLHKFLLDPLIAATVRASRKTVSGDNDDDLLTLSRQLTPLFCHTCSDLSELAGERGHAPGPHGVEEMLKRIQLLLAVSAGAVHPLEVNALLEVPARRQRVEKHKLARRADAEVPRCVAHRRVRDFLPPRALPEGHAGPSSSVRHFLQDLAVGVRRRA